MSICSPSSMTCSVIACRTVILLAGTGHTSISTTLVSVPSTHTRSSSPSVTPTSLRMSTGFVNRVRTDCASSSTVSVTSRARATQMVIPAVIRVSGSGETVSPSPSVIDNSRIKSATVCTRVSCWVATSFRITVTGTLREISNNGRINSTIHETAHARTTASPPKRYKPRRPCLGFNDKGYNSSVEGSFVKKSGGGCISPDSAWGDGSEGITFSQKLGITGNRRGCCRYGQTGLPATPRGSP